jgi:pSer/pThr/pTyr-binding forkhead associated (FHA) protein
MNNKLRAIIGLMEGRSFVIGREGHICIKSPTASKYHATIKVSNGKIYLRDLNSTNGTYLINNNSRQRFEEGYVSPEQLIEIGDEERSIQSLLAIAVKYSDAEDTKHQDKTSVFGSIKRLLEK